MLPQVSRQIIPTIYSSTVALCFCCWWECGGGGGGDSGLARLRSCGSDGGELLSEKMGVTEMCADLINSGFQMCFVQCTQQSARFPVAGDVCVWRCTHIACMYAHRKSLGLALEREQGMDNQLTVNWLYISFLFASFLLFQDNKPTADMPSVVTPCRQHGGLLLQPVFEHSALSICCVLAAFPTVLYPVVSVCPQPGLVCS